MQSATAMMVRLASDGRQVVRRLAGKHEDISASAVAGTSGAKPSVSECVDCLEYAALTHG